MKPAPALAQGFPDLSGMRIARAFANGQIEWS